MRYFKCILEYDGTNYSGWQRQANTSKTIQEKVERALAKIEKSHVTVHGCSRTDAGVHACGQVIRFGLEANIPAERIPVAINSLLPTDIRVKEAKEVGEAFHPRFHAIGKMYQYHIDNGKIQSAFRRHYAYHVAYPLDVKAMQEAAPYLIGRNDFSSFRATGCVAKSPVRHLRRVEITPTKNDFICLEFEGDGFLYNMVRILSGTFIYVGLGKLKPSEIKGILEAKDRTFAGPTAPSRGLYLMKVFYDEV